MKIIITGGAGFIGSCLLWKLNQQGIADILVVDFLENSTKWQNLVGKEFTDYIEKDDFLDLVIKNKVGKGYQALIHLGACSSTTERDASYLIKNNYIYSKHLAQWAVENDTSFIYASSGATYGDGNRGYSDADDISLKLHPLNMYGYSKQLFDLWVIKNGLTNKVTGLKFFNVFGPNEYHKGDMRSMVHKGYQQIKATGKLRLFKSYHPNYQDGEQERDFVYVKDAVKVICYFLNNTDKRGIYNLGTGITRTWNELGQAVFSALGEKSSIEYFEMPEILRDKYQYHTQADITKLRKAGYTDNFMELNDSVKDYIGILESSVFL